MLLRSLSNITAADNARLPMILETELARIDTQEPTAEYSVNDLVTGKYQ